jgi:hypothetical protein
MTVRETAPPRGGALTTYFGVLFDPTTAFATLENQPTWGWALSLSIVLVAIGGTLVAPASAHIMQGITETTPDVTALIKNLLFAVLGVGVSCLLVTAILVLSTVLGGGRVSFVHAWALACNCAVITGVASVLNGAIVFGRGPTAAVTMGDLFVLASLKFLATSPFLRAFLYTYNAFNIWYYIIATIGFARVLHVGYRQSVITVLVISLFSALLAGTLTAIQTGTLKL